MENHIFLKLTTLSVIKNSDLEIVTYNHTKHHGVIPLIYADAFHDKPWNLNWDKECVFDPKGLFLSIVDKVPVGFIICLLPNSYGYISVLSVLPSYQNKHIGSTLLNKAVNYFYSKQINDIRVKVDNKNISAFNFYIKRGFEVI